MSGMISWLALLMRGKNTTRFPSLRQPVFLLFSTALTGWKTFFSTFFFENVTQKEVVSMQLCTIYSFFKVVDAFFLAWFSLSFSCFLCVGTVGPKKAVDWPIKSGVSKVPVYHSREPIGFLFLKFVLYFFHEREVGVVERERKHFQ